MKHGAIRERTCAWVVLKPEAGELVAGFDLFEAAVAQPGHRPGIDDRLEASAPGRDGLIFSCLGVNPTLDNVRLIDDRKALGEIGIRGEEAVAIPDRENRWNELETDACGRSFDLLDIPKITVGYPVKDLELIIGKQNAGIAAALGAVEKRDQVVGRAVDLEIEAAIEPAVGVRRGCRLGLGRDP
jgi:hypothetical protein